MDNRILQKVMEDLSSRRQKNEREEDRRRALVIAACPEIGRIMEERREAVLKTVYSAFAIPAAPDLPEKVEQWNAQIKFLLRENGFAEDYLDPVCTCPLCEDTGYKGESKKVLCDCARALYAAHLEKEGAFETEQSFENFDDSVFPDTLLPGSDVTQRRYMQVIRNICEDYADSLPAPQQKTLLLFGGSGLGKTYLLRAIHARARQRGVPSLCITANHFIKVAREAIFSRNQDALDALYETDLLLVDDLGTEPLIENITVEQLFNLLNERQNAHLCTVFSTNLSLNEIKARYTERILSRLFDKRACRMLHFIGQDIRQLPRD